MRSSTAPRVRPTPVSARKQLLCELLVIATLILLVVVATAARLWRYGAI